MLQFINLVMLVFMANASIEISSPSFNNNGYIPLKYTCEGDNINPALTIRNVPSGAQTLAIIVDDPDAPSGTVTHWISWNIAPDAQVKEGNDPGTPGKNTKGANGYMGPCPPGTNPHHYHFKLYALDTKLSLIAGSSKAELENAMKGHILAHTEMIGLYTKKNPNL